MCGICGKICADRNQHVEVDLVRRMADSLQHRGPEADGFWIRGNVGLGHRRLKIIDLEGGAQPMGNEDGSVIVSYNGEIYNFLELRRVLEAKGHRFRTRSDTEVIVHGYEEWGAKVLGHLRGMFAFALWDGARQQLLLARDRLGKKPLYYCCANDAIWFASEMKALLCDPAVSIEILPEAVDAYFTLGYIPAPWTIYRDIFKLEPGHFLLWQAGRFQKQRYWQVDFTATNERYPRHTVQTLQEILAEATRIRLISDVPLGAFLSGGLDSSAVVAMMSRLQSKPVLANAIGFDYEAFNEMPYSRKVAEHCGARLLEYVVKPELEDVLPKLVWHFDEPFADSSAVPTYYVSKMARQNVTVVLSGDGGDESFAGYTRRYRFEALENRLRRMIPPVIRRTLVAGLAAVYPKADWLPRPLRAKTLLTNVSLPPEQAYLNTISIMPEAVRRQVLADEFLSSLPKNLAAEWFGTLYRSAAAEDPVSRAQFVDIHSFLSEDILVKVDRMSMANSLEVRSPLLDQELVAFAASLPASLKLRNGVSKYIFKKAMEPFLPQEIIYRKKHGFEIPVEEWFRHELRDFAAVVLFDAGTDGGIMNRRGVEKIWQQHQSRLRNHGYALWAIMMFKLWMHQHQSQNARTGKWLTPAIV